jgi:hypothetical protein
MSQLLRTLVPTLALLLIATAAAQERADHPRLRAALHELREARNHLKEARDTWPPGYRERALGAMNEAIGSIRTILSVKDVDSFKGVDRGPDYYKRYPDHPRLRAALADLREARAELVASRADFGGRKDQAVNDIDVAVGDILTLIRYRKTPAAVAVESSTVAKEVAGYPRLRAALHELREARLHLFEARDVWPAGYRDRAIESIKGAIGSIRTILAVKDVESFKGVDRGPDYYKRYPDHPRLRAAMSDLREARAELVASRSDFGGRKDRAIDDIDVAVSDILTLIRYKKR